MTRRTAVRAAAVVTPLEHQDSPVSDVPAAEQADVKALIVEELRRLHEGVLARYGLRPSEWVAWKAGQVAR